MGDKTWRCRVCAALQGFKGLLGKNDYRLLAATGDVLGLAPQGGLYYLTELGFGVLKPPLACAHVVSFVDWSDYLT